MPNEHGRRSRIRRFFRQLQPLTRPAQTERPQAESSAAPIDDIDSESASTLSETEPPPIGDVYSVVTLSQFFEAIDLINRSIAPEQARVILLWCMRHFEPLPVIGADQEPIDACPICQEQYGREFGRMPVRIVGVKGCSNHIFCYECIVMSITSGGTNANKCPLCRAQLMEAIGGRLVVPLDENAFEFGGEVANAGIIDGAPEVVHSASSI